MRISTEKVRNGSHVGDILWVCHYHRPDLHKKPLRNLPPTQVQVISNEFLPENKRVYYSESHLVPIKSGKRLKRIIPLVDNTGFRTHCGEEVYLFTTEDECTQEWNKQVDAHCVSLDVKIKGATAFWEEEKSNLLSLKVKNKEN